MRVLRYLALLGILLVPAGYSSQAQVSIGIGVGVPAYGPPACAYGYYGSYPYACAPYGYYGPSWFADGVFIGAGPWYHRPWGWRSYGYRGWGYDHPGYYRHDDDDGYRGWDRGGHWGRDDFHGRGWARGGEGFHGNWHGGGWHGRH